MALFGEILHQNQRSIRIRIATTLGDAKDMGIQGEHTIGLADVMEIRRANVTAYPPRIYDEIEVNSRTLDRLSRQSVPV